MPHKLEYEVCHFTSEDAGSRAQELQLQGPGVRGWCSAKFAIYPQELVLRFRQRCHLARVQILAHQACIPERIQLLIGDCPPEEEVSLQTAQFTALGYVSLSSNSHTQHKARELKSVNVDCTGIFLKLLLYKNYVNKLNKYNQVALVALNALGNEVEDNNNSVSPDGEGGRVPSVRRAEAEGDGGQDFPPHHDLAFTMYVDTEVAAVMHQLSLKRIAAKRDDRLEYCRRLQRAAELLKVAGERLGKFEIEKRLALDSNDFDKAKSKSELIIDYRQQVYESLALDDLLEKKGRLNSNDSGDFSDLPTLPPTPGFTSPPSTSSVPFKAYGTHLPPARPAHSPPVHPPPSPPRPYSPPPPVPKTTPPLPGLRSSRNPPEGEETLQPGHGASGAPRAMSAPSPSSHNSYDERTLPALKHRAVDDPRDRESWAPRTPSMTEAERKDAALPILVFGAPMVDRFYSKNYSDKEAGLLLLQEAMKEYAPDSSSVRPERFTRAAVFLIQKGVRDKVFSVAQLACATLSLLLSHFFAKNRVSKKECGTALDHVLPDLLSKTADNAVRTQQLAVSAISEMLTFSLTRGCGSIGVELSRPISHTVHPRSALCRANIAEAQITRIGAAPLPKDRETGFTARQLAEFGLSAVQHPGSDVRKAGERVLLALYLRHPLAVRRVLPHEDEPARKNVLFRNLFEQLDLIDAKRATTPRGRAAGPGGACGDSAGPGGAGGRWVPTTLALAACGGSSNSSSCASNCSANSSSSGGNHTAPHISVAPHESEARGNALCRINSSKDLREDEDEMETLGQPSPLTPSPGGSQASPLTPASLDMEEEKTCIFCGLCDDSLLGPGLDLHYWRSCPLLTRCSHCKQVVEIASLSQHLVDDCDQSGDYRRCERCSEAVHRKEWRTHVASLTCTAAKRPALANHCPLCHENIQPWDGGWRAHLLPGPGACVANPRNQAPHKADHGRKQVDYSSDHRNIGFCHGRKLDCVDHGEDQSFITPDDPAHLPANAGRCEPSESGGRFADLRRTASADQGGGAAALLHHDQGGDRRAAEARGVSGGAHTLPRQERSKAPITAPINGSDVHSEDYSRASPGSLSRGGARTKIATPVGRPMVGATEKTTFQEQPKKISSKKF